MEEVPPPSSFLENLLFAVLGGIAAIIVGMGTFSGEKVDRKISSVPESRPRKPAGREEIEKIEREENSERLIEFYRGVDSQPRLRRGKRISTVNRIEPTAL